MRKIGILAALLAVALVISVSAQANEPSQAKASGSTAAAECSIDLAITSDGPIFNYIPGKTYTLAVNITNTSKTEIALDKVDLTWKSSKEFALAMVTDSKLPASIAPGAVVTDSWAITFPEAAAGQLVTLTAKAHLGDKVESGETSLIVSPQFEITLLPARVIFDASGAAKRVGMSVINHTDTPFKGKITLKTYPGVKVNPSSFDASIDAQGLEAYVFDVTPDKGAAPGHYAVFIDAGGKGTEWVAADNCLVVKKAQGKINIDGKLDDWKDAASIKLQRPVSQPDGSTKYEPMGKAMFTYDDTYFYAAFEIEEANHFLSPDSRSRTKSNPPERQHRGRIRPADRRREDRERRIQRRTMRNTP